MRLDYRHNSRLASWQDSLDFLDSLTPASSPGRIQLVVNAELVLVAGCRQLRYEGLNKNRSKGVHGSGNASETNYLGEQTQDRSAAARRYLSRHAHARDNPGSYESRASSIRRHGAAARSRERLPKWPTAVRLMKMMWWGKRRSFISPNRLTCISKIWRKSWSS